MSRLGQGSPWQRIFPQPFQLLAGKACQIMPRTLPSWLLCNCILSFIVTSPPQAATAPSGPGPPHYRGFAIALKHPTLGRTPLDEWSARRCDLNVKTHNSQIRQTSMPPEGFELTIPGSKRPQNYALNRAATRIEFIVKESDLLRASLNTRN